MGGIKNRVLRARNALVNILWLNFRRMKRDVFWRVLLVLIHFMLFFSASVPLGVPVRQTVVDYVFVLTALANILFITVRFQSASGAAEILLAMGSSKLFIVADRTVEMLFSVFLGAVLFVLSLFFVKPVLDVRPLIALDFGLIAVVTPLLTGIMLVPLEGRNRGRS